MNTRTVSPHPRVSCLLFLLFSQPLPIAGAVGSECGVQGLTCLNGGLCYELMCERKMCNENFHPPDCSTIKVPCAKCSCPYGYMGSRCQDQWPVEPPQKPTPTSTSIPRFSTTTTTTKTDYFESPAYWWQMMVDWHGSKAPSANYSFNSTVEENHGDDDYSRVWLDTGDEHQNPPLFPAVRWRCRPDVDDPSWRRNMYKGRKHFPIMNLTAQNCRNDAHSCSDSEWGRKSFDDDPVPTWVACPYKCRNKRRTICMANSDTFPPTMAPTSASPSTPPTTLHPTVPPTQYPTVEPTEGPTASPTISPSQITSKTPSIRPSAMPTTEPTAGPTSNPTSSPSQNPTKGFTVQPSAMPTTRPTAEPTTGRLTSNPTEAPSQNPTKRPTTRPSAMSATEPTVQGTAMTHKESAAYHSSSAPPTVSIKPSYQSSTTLFVNLTASLVNGTCVHPHFATIMDSHFRSGFSRGSRFKRDEEAGIRVRVRVRVPALTEEEMSWWVIAPLYVNSHENDKAFSGRWRCANHSIDSTIWRRNLGKGKKHLAVATQLAQACGNPLHTCSSSEWGRFNANSDPIPTWVACPFACRNKHRTVCLADNEEMTTTPSPIVPIPLAPKSLPPSTPSKSPMDISKGNDMKPRGLCPVSINFIRAERRRRTLSRVKLPPCQSAVDPPGCSKGARVGLCSLKSWKSNPNFVSDEKLQAQKKRVSNYISQKTSNYKYHVHRGSWSTQVEIPEFKKNQLIDPKELPTNPGEGLESNEPIKILTENDHKITMSRGIVKKVLPDIAERQFRYRPVIVESDLTFGKKTPSMREDLLLQPEFAETHKLHEKLPRITALAVAGKKWGSRHHYHTGPSVTQSSIRIASTSNKKCNHRFCPPTNCVHENSYTKAKQDEVNIDANARRNISHV